MSTILTKTMKRVYETTIRRPVDQPSDVFVLTEELFFTYRDHFIWSTVYHLEKLQDKARWGVCATILVGGWGVFLHLGIDTHGHFVIRCGHCCCSLKRAEWDADRPASEDGNKYRYSMCQGGERPLDNLCLKGH